MTESACNWAPGCPRCKPSYSPPAHRMTDQELRDIARGDLRPFVSPTSPWVQRAIAGTLPAPTLAPTQAEIDAELFERYRFAFRVR